jgi:ATP-binding cassette subfamily B protein
MLCNYYGIKSSLEELLLLTCTDDLKGTTMYNLKIASEKLGFDCEGIKMNKSCINRRQVPCIAHLRSEHFVVIYEVRKGTIYTADPDLGNRKYSMVEFNQLWLNSSNSGVLLLVKLRNSKGRFL